MSGDSKENSIQEKNKGNEEYKKKNFDQAIKHYDSAIALDPNNIVFYTNKAAVYFEKNQFEECIKLCEKAVDVGRANDAPYKTSAKALSRMAAAYHKLDQLDNAVKYYEKSLTEFRDTTIVKKLNELEKEVKERKELAYIDPLKADEEKTKGNDFFKSGQFPEAIKCYTEALRRNPVDHKIYSNRAACFTKLMEFGKALEDVNKCIELEPTFLKAYLRKGHCMLGMKNHSGARIAFEKALELDPGNQEAADGLKRSYTPMGGGGGGSVNADDVKQRAMNDPEIKAILSDPVMNHILQQMQDNPKSIQEHLQDEVIKNKFAKLMEAGLVQLR